ncbi:MAG: SDR family NAD(P)-dependent oxidoreductase [Terricaulis sp.]
MEAWPLTTRNLALVTGASAGIGAAFARALAARGNDVALVARRLDRLEALAAELKQAHGVDAFAIQADLSVVDAHKPIMEALAARGREADTLINNAGFSIPQTFAATDWAKQRDFIMTLVTAVAGLTHAVLPGMIARKRGGIINVSSITALSPGAAGHTLYPAAKAFVWKFSLSLDAEVRAKGVRVTCVLPGNTDSEFSHANGMEEVFKETARGPSMTAEHVVDLTLKANDRGDVICIPGVANKIGAALLKYLPDELTAPLIRSVAEKYRMPE